MSPQISQHKKDAVKRVPNPRALAHHQALARLGPGHGNGMRAAPFVQAAWVCAHPSRKWSPVGSLAARMLTLPSPSPTLPVRKAGKVGDHCYQRSSLSTGRDQGSCSFLALSFHQQPGGEAYASAFRITLAFLGWSLGSLRSNIHLWGTGVEKHLPGMRRVRFMTAGWCEGRVGGRITVGSVNQGS